ncbi:arsenical pump-driving ATPase [Peptococcaceae bacterium CEB3]|nr:arsenical pump-driving ATPase [Peptococcaceae bacterium CEB3]
MPKYLFFSGKGGVGKTSMACTTAVYYADQGKKTLIVTTDPASNLADVFEQEIGHKITPITGMSNLFAMEIDPDRATEEYKERSLAPLRDLFDADILKVADEQLSGPCTVEMASFDKFIDLLGTDDYEVIIFDTAPTGHTLRLLELPVDWSRHIEASAQGSGQTCMGPVSLIQESKLKYDEAIAKLRDSGQTEFLFVMQPAQVSLTETERSVAELAEMGIKTTTVIVNGLIPETEAVNQYFHARYEAQQHYLELAHQAFPNVELKTMELFPAELKGLARFRASGRRLFGSTSQAFLPDLLFPALGKQKMIFFAGKGGVGKTTLACLTAVYTAVMGYKTLLLTTDPAAHTGQILDVPVTDTISQVEGLTNLYAVKIDQKTVTEEYKEAILSEARTKYEQDTVAAMAEELDSPCTEEMAAFQKFIDHTLNSEFDITVFDTAPTGHTLRLLELPMDWSSQIEFKAGAGTGVSAGERAQQARFQAAIERLRDPELTTFAFVMYPEKTPIIEAYRAGQELAGIGIKTNLAVANQLIPAEAATTPFFRSRREMQLGYLEEIRERFPQAYLLEMPLAVKDVQGRHFLWEMARQVLG